MKLSELSKLPGHKVFRPWGKATQSLRFDTTGVLVDAVTGKSKIVYRQMFDQDWEIICSHPEDKWSAPYVSAGKVYLTCTECSQVVRISKVETVVPPHVALDEISATGLSGAKIPSELPVYKITSERP